MLKINQLVNATYRHLRISFLYSFKGYHQIALAAKDQEKTAFISPDAKKANKRKGTLIILKKCSKYFGGISCILMLTSVLLELGLANSLGI